MNVQFQGNPSNINQLVAEYRRLVSLGEPQVFSTLLAASLNLNITISIRYEGNDPDVADALEVFLDELVTVEL